MNDERFIPAALVGLTVGFLVEGSIAAVRRDPAVSAVGAWAIGAIAANSWRRIDSPSIDSTALTFAILLGIESVALIAWNGYEIYRQQRRPWTDRCTNSGSNEPIAELS
jgi:hypothetical protein